MDAPSLSAAIIVLLFAVTVPMAAAQQDKKDAKQAVIDYVVNTLKPKIGSDCIARIDLAWENPDANVTDPLKKKRDWDRAFCKKIRKFIDDLNLDKSLEIEEKTKVGDTEFTLRAVIHPTAKAGAPRKPGDNGKIAQISKSNANRMVALAVGGNGGRGADAVDPNTSGTNGGGGGAARIDVGTECIAIAVGGNAGVPGISTADANGQSGSVGGPATITAGDCSQGIACAGEGSYGRDAAGNGSTGGAGASGATANINVVAEKGKPTHGEARAIAGVCGDGGSARSNGGLAGSFAQGAVSARAVVANGVKGASFACGSGGNGGHGGCGATGANGGNGGGGFATGADVAEGLGGDAGDGGQQNGLPGNPGQAGYNDATLKVPGNPGQANQPCSPK